MGFLSNLIQHIMYLNLGTVYTLIKVWLNYDVTKLNNAYLK